MSPQELNQALSLFHKQTPELSTRVAELAQQMVGQPYKLHVLGEYPFQTVDSGPLVSLDQGDCVVFAEHVYSMALADDWQTFFLLLQRIRYKNGEISIITRNHYTLADWNPNNAWLLYDITDAVGNGKCGTVVEIIDRSSFFKKEFNINHEFAIEEFSTTYIPSEAIDGVTDKLRNGDMVNVIRRSSQGDYYCGHVGIVSVDKSGTVQMIHSRKPRVTAESIRDYVASEIAKNAKPDSGRNFQFVGLKFLRLQEDPLDRLVQIDGEAAPLVTGPRNVLSTKKANTQGF